MLLLVSDSCLIATSYSSHSHAVSDRLMTASTVTKKMYTVHKR